MKSKLEIRQAVIKMAKAGTPGMVKVYQDFVAENERNLPPTKEPEPETAEEFAEI